jgi:hypothetical protein
MRTGAILVLLLAPERAFAFGIPAPVSNTEVQRFTYAEWTEVRRLADVDSAVLSSLYSWIGGAKAMADAGGAFNSSDVKTGDPGRRFVVAGRSMRAHSKMAIRNF